MYLAHIKETNHQAEEGPACPRKASPMYLPASFRARDAASALALIRDYPFATVLSVLDGAPMVSYLPCVILATGPHLLIGAHFAKANQHWKHVEAAGATLLFHGPHGYISPRWYVDPPRNVPTWNYAVVHATAQARLAGEEETRAILDRLAIENEGTVADAWTIDGADAKYIASQLNGIVGVHFTVTSIDAKFKLSQNRKEEDRNGAIAGLRATGRAGDRDLAFLMEQQSTQPEG